MMRATHDSYDIREVAPDDLLDPPTNPNRMSAETYAMLVEAIRSVGFLQPVLAQETPEGLVIVDGYHRVRAAKEVGLSLIPVMVGDFQDAPDLPRIVQIGMNRMRGELDLAAVASTVARLTSEGWTVPQLELTGFSKSELDDLLASTQRQDSEVLGGSLGKAPTDEDEREGDEGGKKPFVLELLFAKREELARAKRGLKKAAGGRGHELSEGLLKLLDGA